ncbi:hypothetical protein D3C74_481620 [compost metagenome]
MSVSLEEVAYVGICVHAERLGLLSVAPVELGVISVPLVLRRPSAAAAAGATLRGSFQLFL